MNKYLPVAPTNVRGVIAGIEYPLKLSYLGQNEHGHLWAAAWPDGVDTPPWALFDGIRADKMPPHTGISLAVGEQ